MNMEDFTDTAQPISQFENKFKAAQYGLSLFHDVIGINPDWYGQCKIYI